MSSLPDYEKLSAEDPSLLGKTVLRVRARVRVRVRVRVRTPRCSARWCYT